MGLQRSNVWRDMSIVFLSVLVAIILIKTGALRSLLGATQAMGFIGSFIAGIFFTSIFTSVPATVALIEISSSHSLFWTAFFGGLGALCWDFVIFRFVRGGILNDLLHRGFQNPNPEWFVQLFKPRPLRWITPFIGAIIVASPFPDEIGLAMMGLSKMSTRTFVPLSFLLNFMGIFVMGLITRSV